MAPPAIIPEVVSQFMDNAASGWHDREHAAQSRTFLSKFEDVDRLDALLDAHIDGLRANGEKGWSMALQALESQGLGEIFTVATLAFQRAPANTADSYRVQALLDSIEKPASAVRPLTVALDWTDPNHLAFLHSRFSLERGALAEALALRAAAANGMVLLNRTAAALVSDSPFLIRAACDVAIMTGERTLVDAIELHMNPSDTATAPAAAFAACILGSRRAKGVLQQMALSPRSSEAEMAATTLFRSMTPREALTMHSELFERDRPTRSAIRGAAAAGIRELVPFLIENLNNLPLARLAYEALSEITGADFKQALPNGGTLEHSAADPTDDPHDENIDLDPDEGRPWPSSVHAQEWWSKHRLEFAPLTRYLKGVVVCEESLKVTLHAGPQTIRRAAAELLALSGRPLFDVCAPAFRQTEKLAREAWWR